MYEYTLCLNDGIDDDFDDHLRYEFKEPWIFPSREAYLEALKNS